MAYKDRIATLTAKYNKTAASFLGFHVELWYYQMNYCMKVVFQEI